MALRTIPSVIKQQAALQALRGPQISPLDAIMGGVQQGLQLQQLPQQLQDQELARQLNNALLAQKLQDLQNPNAAISREFQRQLVLSSLNPATGITVAQPGAETLTVATPSAIGQTEAGLEQALAVNPNLPIPTAVAGAPITPIINPITGQATGLVRDVNIPRALKQQTLNDQIALTNARYQAAGIPGKTVVDENGEIQFIPTRAFGGQAPTATAVKGEGGTAIKAQVKPSAKSGAGALTENAKLIAFRKASEAGLDPEDPRYLNEDTQTPDFTKLVIDTGKASRENKRLADAAKAGALTGKAKTDIEALNAAEKQLHTLQDEITDIAKSGKTPTFFDNLIAAETAAPPTGFFSAGWQNLLKGVQSDESKLLEDKKSIISSSLVKAISGLAVSKQEAARLGFVPRAGDSFEELVRKAAGVQEYINNQREGLQIPLGGSVSFPIATPGINPQGTNPIQIRSIRLKQ